jgi:hypothetical protein
MYGNLLHDTNERIEVSSLLAKTMTQVSPFTYQNNQHTQTHTLGPTDIPKLLLGTTALNASVIHIELHFRTSSRLDQPLQGTLVRINHGSRLKLIRLFYQVISPEKSYVSVRYRKNHMKIKPQIRSHVEKLS